MAQLRITISGVTVPVTIDDAKATVIANLFFDAEVVPNWPEGVPLPTTPQERLQAVTNRVAIQMRDVARGQKRHKLRTAHEAQVEAEMAAIGL